MQGISPRYIQDKISNALVSEQAHRGKMHQPVHGDERAGIGLEPSQPITDEETKKRYRDLLGMVKEEYEDILKSEVQRAISADEDAIKRLCSNYIENVRAYTQHEKVRNKYTGKDEEPDERLMRSIEEKIDIPESRKDDFRQEIMNYIGALRWTARSSSTTPTPGCTRRSSSSCSRISATRSSSRTWSPAWWTTKRRPRSTWSSSG
jgi:serine protein kinase